MLERLALPTLPELASFQDGSEALAEALWRWVARHPSLRRLEVADACKSVSSFVWEQMLQLWRSRPQLDVVGLSECGTLRSDFAASF